MTETTVAQPVAAAPGHNITFLEAFWVWVRVAIYSFGGPAGQIAVMHRIVVEEKRWVSENRFLHALNYTMLLPGPEAQQLATYLGWLLHGMRGGLVAGILFVLPGFITMLTFVAIFFFNVPFPLIILTAGLIGVAGGRVWEKHFFVIKGHEVDDDAVITNQIASHTRPSLRRATLTLIVCLFLWFTPLLFLWLRYGEGKQFMTQFT